MREKVNTDSLKAELAESLQFPVDLLKSQMVRLSLKDKPFQTFEPAKQEEIDALWKLCLEVDKDLKVQYCIMHRTIHPSANLSVVSTVIT